MKPTKRKAFNFLRSYYDIFNKLKTDKDKLSFLESLLDKQFLDKDPEELNFVVDLAYEGVRHQIEQSVKGYKTKTKDEMQGVCQGGTQGGAQGVRLQEEEKEKEQEKEEEKEQEQEEYTSAKAFTTFHFKKTLLDLGVDKEHLEDWLKIRTKKKASNTKTALKTFLNECNRNNFPISEAVKICAQNDWKGFKYEWIKTNNNGQTNKNEKYNYDDLKRKLATTLRSG